MQLTKCANILTKLISSDGTIYCIVSNIRDMEAVSWHIFITGRGEDRRWWSMYTFVHFMGGEAMWAALAPKRFLLAV